MGWIGLKVQTLLWMDKLQFASKAAVVLFPSSYWSGVILWLPELRCSSAPAALQHIASQGTWEAASSLPPVQ